MTILDGAGEVKLKVPELTWSPGDDSAYDDDLLLDVISGLAVILIRGRNAWHSTWVQHYMRNATLFTDVASAKAGAETQRERGNVFYIVEAPAIQLRGRLSNVVLCDAHPDNPLGGITGVGTQVHSSAYGEWFGGVFPGVSVREAVSAFAHDAGYWKGPEPTQHSPRAGRLAPDFTIAQGTRKLASTVSQARTTSPGYRASSDRVAIFGDAGTAVLCQGEEEIVELTIGSAHMSVFDAPVVVQGEAFTGGHQHGTAIACEVRTPDGGILEVGLVQWEHGDRDVRCFSRLAGPLMYDRLVKGARLGVAIKRPGDWDTELGILTNHNDRLPTVVKAAWSDLDSVVGGSAADLLLSVGATAVGTKEETIADTGKRRGYLVMVSPQDQPIPPLAAYVMTRVLPLMSGFGSSAAVPVGLA